jgi:hypothetical protein
MRLLQRLKEWRQEAKDDRETTLEERARELVDDEPEQSSGVTINDFPNPR